jgi:hypothetical protein
MRRSRSILSESKCEPRLSLPLPTVSNAECSQVFGLYLERPCDTLMC